MRKMSVVNASKNTILGGGIGVAETAKERSVGLLRRTDLPRGEGLWIVPSEMVHTFWMKFPIDLVFLDRKLRVTKVTPRLKPFRIAGSLWAHSVLELPAGAAEETLTERGDRIEMQPAPESSKKPQASEAAAAEAE